MGNTQVITIDATGAVSGLQHKPGKGLDLTTLGRAEVTRVSLVEWCPTNQAWYVDILQEHGRGKLTEAKMEDAYAGLDRHIGDSIRVKLSRPWRVAEEGGLLLFTTYDDGVAGEIYYLNLLRLNGRH